jgi:LPXTG-motif cell wall-anchored protein
MNKFNSFYRLGMSALAAAAVCLVLGVNLSAQVQTQTTTTAGHSEHQVTIEKATVVQVNGNSLIVKMDDGTIRHFPNIADSVKVNVDGQQLGVHELKPGMHLQRTSIATTTPMTITTVQTVTGKVWHVNPPSSVILTLENGENQQFSIPKGQMFKIDGQMVDAWGLKKGMKVSATKVVESTEIQVANQRRLAGTMPPPPPDPPADEPILVAKGEPVAAPTATADLPAKLPKTGSLLPLFAMFGSLLLVAGLLVQARRC